MEDFSNLREIVTNAYGGFGYFEAKGGEWDKHFDAAAAELRERSNWETAAYFGVLMRLFKSVGVVDGHLSLSARSVTFNLAGSPGLSVWWPRFSDYYVRKSGGKFFLIARSVSVPSIDGELLSVDGASPDRFLFPTYVPDRPGELFLLGYFGDQIRGKLLCRIAGTKDTKELKLHAGRMFRFGRPMPLFEEKRVDGIPVLSLRTLRDENAADLERFVKTAEKLRREPVVVLDMRGNDGGSDGYGIRWLQMLSSSTVRVAVSQDERISPWARVGAVNHLKERLHEVGDAQNQAAFETRLAVATKALEASETKSGERARGFPFFDLAGKAPENFTGRLIVLSDRRNGSAGESFLEMAKALPGTVVVGENSNGVNAFGPIGLYQLPHSSIRLTMGTAITRWGGEIREGSGILPDVWIDEPDILPAVVSYAKTLTLPGP